MCLAIKQSDALIEVLEKLKNTKFQLEKLQSEYDKKLSDMYHEIEINKYHASAGYKKLMEVQEIARKRRVIKHELAEIQKLTAAFNVGNVLESIKRVQKAIRESDENNINYRKNWNIEIDDLMTAI
jgi:hypothetical protein